MNRGRVKFALSVSVFGAAIGVVGLPACDQRGRAGEAATHSDESGATVVLAGSGGRLNDHATPDASAREAGTQVSELAARAEPCSVSQVKGGGICCLVRASLVYAPARPRDCDTAQCAARGGHCGWAGFTCPKACIAPARDHGQPCSDVAQCESTCVAPDNVAQGQATIGHCYEYALALECLNRVRHGHAEGTVCIE